MIPRNTASQSFRVGPLIDNESGDPVTTGAAILIDNGSSGTAGGGTLAHFHGGVWRYTPTQAETDAGIPGGVLYKTGAYDVPFNLVTTRLPVQTPGVLPDAAAGTSSGIVLKSDVTTTAELNGLLDGVGGLTTEQAAALLAVASGVDFLANTQLKAVAVSGSTQTLLRCSGTGLSTTVGDYNSSSDRQTYVLGVNTASPRNRVARLVTTSTVVSGVVIFNFASANQWPVAPSADDEFAVLTGYK